MPTPLIPNANKVTVKGTLFGQVVENVWAVGTTGAPTEAAQLTIASIFQTGYAALMLPLSNELSINEITVRYMGSADGPESTLVISPAQTGGAEVVSSPGNVALCVSLRSGLAGRRFRGRKFFSGIPEQSTANNAIDAALCDAVLEGINTMIATLIANGTPLVVVSLVGLTSVAITTAICTDFFVDSQRRRLTGRGR